VDERVECTLRPARFGAFPDRAYLPGCLLPAVADDRMTARLCGRDRLAGPSALAADQPDRRGDGLASAFPRKLEP
jgi:hypothetical protein